MYLLVSHGSLHSFSYCKVRKKTRTNESARGSSTSCHGTLYKTSVSCSGSWKGFSTKGLFTNNGGDLSCSGAIWEGCGWSGNAIGDRSLLLRVPIGEKGGELFKGRAIRGVGFTQETKKSSERRKEQQRKRGRKKSGLKADDVHASTGYWRLFGVEVSLEKDLGKDDISVSDAVLEAIALALKCRAAQLPNSAFSVVRKSLDARKFPRFVYTIDLDVESFVQTELEAKTILSFLRAVPGKAEFSPSQRSPLDLVARLTNLRVDAIQAGVDAHVEACSSSSGLLRRDAGNRGQEPVSTSSGSRWSTSTVHKAKVVVVGSGPAGLFAALSLAETGVEVILLERGQPVESRGRDIGALMVRRILDPNSNLCYGEGGAGTWSDGKLTTRIGKNGSNVQTVLATLVRFGAPPQILVDGKPHLGTDKLVHILRNLRSHLLGLGVNIMFGTKMDDLEVQAGRVTGVRFSRVHDNQSNLCGDFLEADAVVLAVGHSARDVFDTLLHHNVSMTAKPFAVGFRIEHPQELINEMQYHRWANEVQRGKGKLPVADYKLAADVGSPIKKDSVDAKDHGGRGCFSFCMCPGGQERLGNLQFNGKSFNMKLIFHHDGSEIGKCGAFKKHRCLALIERNCGDTSIPRVVPTSTSASELCINGMSFSNRASKWANAALVVSVTASDFSTVVSDSGPHAGVAFQREIEREAALRGGGNFTVPAQTVTDFLDDRLTGDTLPSSSYRLGVRAAYLHDILPSHLTESLKEALLSFERQLPGFIDKRALLHGVETRTSSPVQIDRCKETFESTSLAGLYPIGEGAGHAGGIVSAAVDGMLVGLQLAKQYSPANTMLQDRFV